MDLNLSLTYQEQNDNKAIILTDTTTNYSSSTTHLTADDSMVAGDFYEVAAYTTDFTTYGAPVGFGVGTRFVGNGTFTLIATDDLIPVTPTIAEITVATLDTTITGVDEVSVAKSQIDLISQYGPFTTQADMVYTVTAVLLGDAADSLLLDGLYELTYIISYAGDGIVNTKTDTLVVTILVYGQVKVATYEKLRSIPVQYMCVDGCPSSEISEADLCGAYLSGIENSAYIAKTEELLAMLVVLDGIINNSSKITW